MGNLVEKIKWSVASTDGNFENNYSMYVYGEADMKANQAMQDPLEKLYNYEHKPDMILKVKDYITEIDAEIKRIENEVLDTDDKDYEARMMTRLDTLIDVRSDLLGLLEE